MNQPVLLLLDEPGGNLDEVRATDLHRLLLDLAREGNVSVVAVTHNLDLAREADRWFRLDEGRLAAGA
jgi:ABC-type lipoprotein export system ATPase subunit